MTDIIKRFAQMDRPNWVLRPGQRFVVPVQYRPSNTLFIAKCEVAGGPVTGSIAVDSNGNVALRGRSREWILWADDLIGEK